jgi:hypothetical protein
MVPAPYILHAFPIPIGIGYYPGLTGEPAQRVTNSYNGLGQLTFQYQAVSAAPARVTIAPP